MFNHAKKLSGYIPRLRLYLEPTILKMPSRVVSILLGFCITFLLVFGLGVSFVRACSLCQAEAHAHHHHDPHHIHDENCDHAYHYHSVATSLLPSTSPAFLQRLRKVNVTPLVSPFTLPSTNHNLAPTSSTLPIPSATPLEVSPLTVFHDVQTKGDVT